mmetsp:Transcript_122508/g.318478  ORF Transcript_122508/g.318478 Transcript_122508/m.318478 type:complete len:282 (-) Transcript_122508:715-1560(-)
MPAAHKLLGMYLRWWGQLMMLIAIWLDAMAKDATMMPMSITHLSLAWWPCFWKTSSLQSKAANPMKVAACMSRATILCVSKTHVAIAHRSSFFLSKCSLTFEWASMARSSMVTSSSVSSSVSTSSSITSPSLVCLPHIPRLVCLASCLAACLSALFSWALFRICLAAASSDCLRNSPMAPPAEPAQAPPTADSFSLCRRRPPPKAWMPPSSCSSLRSLSNIFLSFGSRGGAGVVIPCLQLVAIVAPALASVKELERIPTGPSAQVAFLLNTPGQEDHMLQM